MKKLIFSVFTVFCVSVSCKKEHCENRLQGDWKLWKQLDHNFICVPIFHPDGTFEPSTRFPLDSYMYIITDHQLEWDIMGVVSGELDYDFQNGELLIEDHGAWSVLELTDSSLVILQESPYIERYFKKVD